MPALLQASISRVPAGAVTFLPSTVMFTSAIKIVFGPTSLVVRKPSVPAVFGRRPTANDTRPTHKYSRSTSSPTPAFSNGHGLPSK